MTRHFSSDAEGLDVGCGSGSLAQHFERYTGVDSLPESVAAAQARRNVLQDGSSPPLRTPSAGWERLHHKRPFTRTSLRLLFADQSFEVEQVGYESVMPGISVISGYTKEKRRALKALAGLPIVRRSVWLVAQRPPAC